MTIMRPGLSSVSTKPIHWLTFLGWPVYYDSLRDQFYFEADGYHLVEIQREQEGMIQLADIPSTLADLFARMDDRR